MLGALVVFIQIMIYGYWWELYNDFKVYKEMNTPITIWRFVLYSAATFFTIAPVLCLIFVFIVLAITTNNRHVNDNDRLLIGGVASLVITSGFLVYQYKKYKHLIKLKESRKVTSDNGDSGNNLIGAEQENGKKQDDEYNGKWTVKEFKEMYGDIQYRESTGDFRFGEIIVYPDATLKKLSIEQYKEIKDKLRIKQLWTGRYCMYKEWEDVDLGI